jgi:hypothetical protein
MATLKIRYKKFSRGGSDLSFCRRCLERFKLDEEIISHSIPRKHYHLKCARLLHII